MVRKVLLFGILIFGSYAYSQPNDIKINPSDKPIPSFGNKNSMVAFKDSYISADRPNNESNENNGKVKGKRHVRPYRITNSRYIAHSLIQKSIGPSNEIKIKIMKNGLENTDIEDFSMAYDSGTEYRMSNVYGLQNTTMPLYVKVTYRSWNTFHAVQSDCVFEFVIYSRGSWDVTLFN